METAAANKLLRSVPSAQAGVKAMISLRRLSCEF
jgi:hypothetical protein